DREPERGRRARTGDRVPEPAPPVLRGRHHHRGQRQQHQQAHPEHRGAEPDRPAAPAAPRDRGGRGGPFGRGHPALPAIWVTMPVFLSKYFLLTWLQPPSSAIVASLATVGYGCAGSLAPSTSPGSTPCTAGRKPLLAKIF